MYDKKDYRYQSKVQHLYIAGSTDAFIISRFAGGMEKNKPCTTWDTTTGWLGDSVFFMIRCLDCLSSFFSAESRMDAKSLQCTDPNAISSSMKTLCFMCLQNHIIGFGVELLSYLLLFFLITCFWMSSHERCIRKKCVMIMNLKLSKFNPNWRPVWEENLSHCN